jgi:hypothetical protein
MCHLKDFLLFRYWSRWFLYSLVTLSRACMVPSDFRSIKAIDWNSCPLHTHVSIRCWCFCESF